MQRRQSTQGKIPFAVLIPFLFALPVYGGDSAGDPCAQKVKRCAQLVILDLAGQDPDSAESWPIPANKPLKLRVENMVADGQASYQVSIRRLVQSSPLPDFPGGSPAARPSVGLEIRESCSADFRKNYPDLTTEKDVKAAINEALAKPGCDQDSTLLEEIEKSRRHSGIDPVPKGTNIEVTVTRLANPAKVWTLTLETPSRGEWRFSYGFTFLPNQDKRFFSEQDDDDPTAFHIRQQNDREDLDFLPSVLYHWHSPAARRKKGVPGLVAGLGYDLDEPALFVGPGWTVRENITLTLGAAIYRHSDLAGRYEVGQMLKENIDSEALVEKTFGVNVYFGVAFRFGQNIFQRREQASKAKAQQQAASATKQAEEAKERARQEADADLEAAELELCLKQAAHETDEKKLAEKEAQCRLASEKRKKATRDAADRADARQKCLAKADSKLEAANKKCDEIKNPDDAAKTKCEQDHSDAEPAKAKCLEEATVRTKENCKKEAAEGVTQARVACVGGGAS